MEFAKENPNFVFGSNGLKGELLNKRTPSNLKKKFALKDVANTIHSKHTPGYKGGSSSLLGAKVTRSPFQVLKDENFSKPNGPTKQGSVSKGPKPTAVQVAADEEKDTPFLSCRCKENIEDTYSELPLPESLKLTKEDIDDLINSRIKPKEMDELSFSPVNSPGSYFSMEEENDFGAETELFSESEMNSVCSPSTFCADMYLR